MIERALRRLLQAVTRRPLLVLGLTAVLALGGAALALRLEPSAATDTLVDRGSQSFKDTERFKDDFGDEAILVLVHGELTRTVLTADLNRVLRLEGCLGGNVPDNKKGLGSLPPVCREIAELKPAKVVYGPATFINTAVGQIQDQFAKQQQRAAAQAQQAAEAARRLSKRRGDPRSEQERLARAAADAVQAQFINDTLRLALKYGITGPPQINDPAFVSTLVFDRTAGRPGIPKSRFAYLFPSKNAALIQIRLRPDLSDAEQARAIDLIRTATGEKVFKPREGARYIVTGVPVVAEGLADAIQRSIFILLGAALLLMAATLALVFRSRLRLLPLGLALAAAAMTFGALSLAGGSLTMASIAALPGADRARGGLRHPVPGPLRRGRGARRPRARGGRRGGRRAHDPHGRRRHRHRLPGAAALARADGARLRAAARAGDRAGARLRAVRRLRGADALPQAARRGCSPRASRAWRRFAATRGCTPPASGLRTAPGARSAWPCRGRGACWRSGSRWPSSASRSTRRARSSSDVRELVPQDLQALRDVNVLQKETGVSGEIDVTVRADDITDPAVIGWMTRFQNRVLREHGYRPGKRCTQKRDAPELCPALSLPDLFSTARQDQVSRLLDAVPAYFSQGVVTADRKTANLAFGIRLMPLDRQKQVVDDIKAALQPPDGVEASVVGLPVLAAEANGALSSPWRRGLTLLAALAGVFLVLFAARRSAREAAVPLIPIALATGWSGLVLFILGLLPGAFEVDLNPMSVTLGALVIAISTEFSVLLSARYRQERDGGAGPARAIELAYASTGAAVLASGATAIAGFAALIFSDIRMLRDFGIVTVVDLTVSLLGVMIVLPAALMWAEEHGPFRVRDLLAAVRLRRAQADTP